MFKYSMCNINFKFKLREILETKSVYLPAMDQIALNPI